MKFCKIPAISTSDFLLYGTHAIFIDPAGVPIYILSKSSQDFWYTRYNTIGALFSYFPIRHISGFRSMQASERAEASAVERNCYSN